MLSKECVNIASHVLVFSSEIDNLRMSTIQPNIILIFDRHPSPLSFLRQRASSRLIGASSVGGRNRVCMAHGTGCIRCFVDGIFYTPA